MAHDFSSQPAKEGSSLLLHQYLKGLVVRTVPTPWDRAHRTHLVSLSLLQWQL